MASDNPSLTVKSLRAITGDRIINELSSIPILPPCSFLMGFDLDSTPAHVEFPPLNR